MDIKPEELMGCTVKWRAPFEVAIAKNLRTCDMSGTNEVVRVTGKRKVVLTVNKRPKGGRRKWGDLKQRIPIEWVCGAKPKRKRILRKVKWNSKEYVLKMYNRPLPYNFYIVKELKRLGMIR